MPKYSDKSKERLAECHRDLRIVFGIVILFFDCSIICGKRGKTEQTTAYDSGRSKLQYPKSKHNKEPKSEAVDAVPYPIDWKNTRRMRYFAGFVVAIGEILFRLHIIDHQIRWGGDWDRDTDNLDQRFDDLPHFEIVKSKRDSLSQFLRFLRNLVAS